jgi:putative ABC transport system substrate-binding protein
MLNRPMPSRHALTAFVLLALSPAPAAAQAKVGFLSFHSPSMEHNVEYFKEGMKALGHAEGRTYVLESHFTGGNQEETKEILQTLVKKPVDVLVVWVTPVAHMAKAATQTIPVVMLVSDPLATGLVPSLANPGGNLTGASMAGPDLAGKRLEILREIRPSIKTVAFIGSSKDSNGPTFARETQTAGQRIGVNVLVKFVEGAADFNETLFEGLKRDGAEAAILQPIFTGQGDKIVPLAMKFGIPVIGDYAPLAEAGALITFGVNDTERVRRLAYFVDRILKGAKPADLPVEQPTTFQLVVNTRAAKALGWTISDTFLLRADRVVE